MAQPEPEYAPLTLRSNQMKLYRIDDLKDIQGPRLSNNNGSSLNSCLWLANLLGVYQRRLDHDMMPRNELQTIFRDLMQAPWWKIGLEGVDQQRDEMLQHVGGLSDPNLVPQLWDELTRCLPTTTTVTRTTTVCEDRSRCHIKTGSTNIASVHSTPENASTLSECLRQRFAPRNVRRGKKTRVTCEQCRSPVAEHDQVIDDLAPFLGVSGVEFGVITEKVVKFPYTIHTGAQAPKSSNAAYRLRGGVVAKGDRYEAFGIVYGDNNTATDAVWYDGGSEGSTTKSLRLKELRDRCTKLETDGGVLSMVVLERSE